MRAGWTTNRALVVAWNTKNLVAFRATNLNFGRFNRLNLLNDLWGIVVFENILFSRHYLRLNTEFFPAIWATNRSGVVKRDAQFSGALRAGYLSFFTRLNRRTRRR